nr:hypothetical protein Iba_chr13bCG4620 [Ipomoea batatas]
MANTKSFAVAITAEGAHPTVRSFSVHSDSRRRRRFMPMNFDAGRPPMSSLAPVNREARRRT